MFGGKSFFGRASYDLLQLRFCSQAGGRIQQLDRAVGPFGAAITFPIRIAWNSRNSWGVVKQIDLGARCVELVNVRLQRFFDERGFRRQINWDLDLISVTRIDDLRLNTSFAPKRHNFLYDSPGCLPLLFCRCTALANSVNIIKKPSTPCDIHVLDRCSPAWGFVQSREMIRDDRVNARVDLEFVLVQLGVLPST